MNKKRISIVVPIYNEEENIRLLYELIQELFANLNYDWELIFVNDGSSDTSFDILTKLTKENSQVKVIHFTRNFGQQAAFMAAFDFATGDAVISLDADLQDPPELIPLMCEQWESGFEVVYARRKKRKDKFLKKYFARKFYRFQSRLSTISIPKDVADFRLIDKKVLQELKGMKEYAKFVRGMIPWLGFKHTFIEHDRPSRKHGKTGYTFTKNYKLALDGLLGFSNLPLRLSLFLGIGMLLGGFLTLVGMFLGYLFFETEFASLTWWGITILIVLGLQFILIWILGEYIARIFDQVKQRPIYVIQKKINF
jgi:dolichol-phosphate mannosyltransferase